MTPGLIGRVIRDTVILVSILLVVVEMTIMALALIHQG